MQLTLERRQYSPGDVIAGCVVLDDAHSMNARKVTLRVFASVEGSGSKEEVVVADQPLDRGPVDAERLPFSVPLGMKVPISYEGRHVKVTWRCVVTIDVAWKKDVSEEVTFAVVPAPVTA